jgi:hypothetical protein
VLTEKEEKKVRIEKKESSVREKEGTNRGASKGRFRYGGRETKVHIENKEKGRYM